MVLFNIAWITVCNHLGVENSSSAVQIAGEIPEPGSILVLGLGAITLMRRRRS
jgi:hypothetical protein